MDHTYTTIDPKDLYIDPGTSHTTGYMTPVTTTGAALAGSTTTTTAGGSGSNYQYYTKKGIYSLGQEPNFAAGWRSGVNTLIEKLEPDEDMLERMIDSLYA